MASRIFDNDVNCTLEILHNLHIKSEAKAMFRLKVGLNTVKIRGYELNVSKKQVHDWIKALLNLSVMPQRKSKMKEQLNPAKKNK